MLPSALLKVYVSVSASYPIRVMSGGRLSSSASYSANRERIVNDQGLSALYYVTVNGILKSILSWDG